VTDARAKWTFVIRANDTRTGIPSDGASEWGLDLPAA